MNATLTATPTEPTELQRHLNGLQVELKCSLDNEATARHIMVRLGRIPPTPINAADSSNASDKPNRGLMDEISTALQNLAAANQRTASLLEQLNRTV